MKERIQLNMSGLDVITAMSGGNPGAMTAIMDVMKSAEGIDPDSALGWLGPLCTMDTNEIYDSEIWILYSDISGRSCETMLAILRAVQMGLIRIHEVNSAIAAHRMDAGRVSEIVALVKARLPRFGAAAA